MKISKALVFIFSLIPGLAFAYQPGTYECPRAFYSTTVKIRSVQIEPGIDLPYVELVSKVRGNLQRIRGFAQIYVRAIQKKNMDGTPVRNAKNEVVYVDEEVIRMEIPTDLNRDISSEVLRFDENGDVKDCSRQ